MLKLFRRVRMNLLKQNKVSRYLIYAFGEIILVVIGILLALQINNWNEHRKNIIKEDVILAGIKKDLEEDLNTLNRLDQAYKIRLSNYQLINPDFELRDYDNISSKDSTLRFSSFFGRPRSYRKTEGTYRSLISDGQSGLIRNKTIFSKLQKIYDEEYARIQSIYSTIESGSEQISWKWSKEISYPSHDNIFNINDKNLLADLNYFHFIIRFYISRLNMQKERVMDVLKDIEVELNK